MFRNKYFVFLSDIIAILLAFLLADTLRFGWITSNPMRANVLILNYVTYLVVFTFSYDKTPFYKRSPGKNFRLILRYNVMMALVQAFLMYALHNSRELSRLFFLYFIIGCVVFMYMGRLFTTWLGSRYYRNPAHRKRIVVITNESNVMKSMHKIVREHWIDYDIVGIVLYQGSESCYYRVERRTGELKGKTYLSDSGKGVLEYLKKEAIDEALLSLPDTSVKEIGDLIRILDQMGVNAHLTVNSFDLGLNESTVERFGPYHVFTFSPRTFSPEELFLKRAMDIAGGLAGCLLCAVVAVFVCPAIYLEDPGPVVFKQKRVGRNGRQFYIYKFRSMYQDAEERKKELMKLNEMNGLMFKMKNDPRITKVGKFIRKTSLDEFPQFWNVLMGDMSLVGTRPPTVAEFEEYSFHHKRRLSLKPGITGMWQVSGRSEIKDFEDVVQMDVDYIDRWSIWLDIKILFKTVWVVIAGRGSE